MNKLKFAPKLPIALLYILLLLAALLLFFGRNLPALKIAALQSIFPDFYQHVSNFSISYLLCAAIGYLWLLFGAGFRYVIVLTSVVLLLNIVFELWIHIGNTPDIIDAYYGFWGTLLAFVFLWITKSVGLVENKATAG